MATATEQNTLEAQPRTPGTKNDARRVRKHGKVPGVVYGAGKQSVPVSVDLSGFAQASGQAGEGAAAGIGRGGLGHRRRGGDDLDGLPGCRNAEEVAGLRAAEREAHRDVGRSASVGMAGYPGRVTRCYGRRVGSDSRVRIL